MSYYEYAEYAVPENILWLMIIIIGVIIKRSEFYQKLTGKFSPKIGKAKQKIKDSWLESAIRAYAQDVRRRYESGELKLIEKLFIPIIKLKKYTGTIANLISLLRILLAVIVSLLLIIHHLTQDFLYLFFSLFTFIVASLLDLLDGATARALDEISELGKKLDPVADKILLASVFLTMGIIYMPSFTFWAVIRQESFLLVISGLKWIAEKLPFTMATQANYWGKTKLVFELIGGGLLFLCPLHDIFPLASQVMFVCSIPLAMGSIINYLASVKRVAL